MATAKEAVAALGGETSFLTTSSPPPQLSAATPAAAKPTGEGKLDEADERKLDVTLRRRATEFFVGSAFHGLERGQLEGRSLVAAALWNATLYTLGLVSAAMVVYEVGCVGWDARWRMVHSDAVSDMYQVVTIVKDDRWGRLPPLLYVVDALLLVDLMGDFSRPQYDTRRGAMVFRTKVLAKRLLACWPLIGPFVGTFWLDALALVPFELALPLTVDDSAVITMMESGGGGWLEAWPSLGVDGKMGGNGGLADSVAVVRRLRELVGLVRLLRLLRLPRIYHRHADILDGLSPVLVQGSKLMLLLAGVAHAMACAWSYVGDLEALHYADVMTSGDMGSGSSGGWKAAYVMDSGRGLGSSSSSAGIFSGPRGYGNDDQTENLYGETTRLRWYLVSLQFGMGAALGGHASLANPRVRATSDLESIVATLLGFLGGVLWLYALAEGVRLLQRCRKWQDRHALALDEMNAIMVASNMAPRLRRSLRRHLRRSAGAVRLREGRHHAYSAVSPGLQGQLALAGPETTWVRGVWWLRDRSVSFLMDLAKEMVPEVYAAGEKITRRRTLYCVGAYGIVARNGKVLVKGMVWGEDIIIHNEYLIESANAIALIVSEVHGLSLASILAALSRNPHDVSPYRIAAAKYAMIRGIKKIAMEYKARQRGQLTRNAYVSSLLAKFQDDDFTSKPDTNYTPGDNAALDSALRGIEPGVGRAGGKSVGVRVVSGGVGHSVNNDSFISNGSRGSIVGGGGSKGGSGGGAFAGGGGGASDEMVQAVSDKVGILQRLVERRFDHLNDQSQAALAEQRHVTKVFHEILLTQHGLMTAFREQVGTALAQTASRSGGIGTTFAPAGFQAANQPSPAATTASVDVNASAGASPASTGAMGASGSGQFWPGGVPGGVAPHPHGGGGVGGGFGDNSGGATGFAHPHGAPAHGWHALQGAVIGPHGVPMPPPGSMYMMPGMNPWGLTGAMSGPEEMLAAVAKEAENEIPPDTMAPPPPPPPPPRNHHQQPQQQRSPRAQQQAQYEDNGQAFNELRQDGQGYTDQDYIDQGFDSQGHNNDQGQYENEQEHNDNSGGGAGYVDAMTGEDQQQDNGHRRMSLMQQSMQQSSEPPSGFDVLQRQTNYTPVRVNSNNNTNQRGSTVTGANMRGASEPRGPSSHMSNRLSAATIPKRPSILDKRVSLATLGVGNAAASDAAAAAAESFEQGYGQEDTKEEASSSSRPVHTRKSAAEMAARAVSKTAGGGGSGIGGTSGGTRASVGGGIGVQAGGGGKRFSSMLLPLPRHEMALAAQDGNGSNGRGGGGGPAVRPQVNRASTNARLPSGRAPRPSSAVAYESNTGDHQGNLI